MRLPTTKGDSRKTLVSEKWEQPKTVEELHYHPPSKAGWHAGFHQATCLEAVRLDRNGIRRVDDDGFKNGQTDLTAMTTGSLWHLMMKAEGKGRDGLEALAGVKDVPRPRAEYMETMLRAYRLRWRGQWGHTKGKWRLIGVEAQIKVPIPTLRGKFWTVRYDKVLLDPKGRLYTSEHKTASQHNSWTLESWRTAGQIISQAWAWGRHPLSKKYGRLHHLMDIAVKKPEPEFHREPLTVRPSQIARFQQALVKQKKLEMYCEKEYTLNEEWPRSYGCTGRYGQCPYADLCHWGLESAYKRIK